MKNFAGIISMLICFASCSPKQASLIVYNAKIYTVDDNFSVQQAMAISNDKIVAIGSNDKIKKYAAPNRIDAQGKTIMPGFIDAHCHFTGFATDRWKVYLTGTESWNAILQKLIEYRKTMPMQWLYGRGWDQNDWAVKEFPDRSALDSLFPDVPVYLKRVDGHAAIANAKALSIAGITDKTKVEGGEVEIIDGRLTGMLIDNAMWLVEKHIPEIDDALAIRYYEELQQEVVAQGLTSLHDCGISNKTVKRIEQAQKEQKLDLRIYALMEDDSTLYNEWLQRGRYTNGRLTVGGFKFYADGALGSRGACLIHPYADKPGAHGFMLCPHKHFEAIATRLALTNLQMCTHAIGDSGNRVILDIYQRVLSNKDDKRWRIEHAQIVDENDFGFFANSNIIPSVQPTHATSDMYWAEERLGPARIKNAYAYKKLLTAHGWLPLGTDFPVEDISPFKTFYAAVYRKDAKNYPSGGYQMSNALNRTEALKGMTIWAAKAAFQENEIGSLEKGKQADFILIDTDLMQCAEQDILKTKVLATYIAGEKIF